MTCVICQHSFLAVLESSSDSIIDYIRVAYILTERRKNIDFSSSGLEPSVSALQRYMVLGTLVLTGCVCVCVCVFISRDQHSGQNQNIKVGNKSF